MFISMPNGIVTDLPKSTFHAYTDYLSPELCQRLIKHYKDYGPGNADRLGRYALQISGDASRIQALLKNTVEQMFHRPLVGAYCGFAVYPNNAKGQEMHRDDGRPAPGVDPEGNYGNTYLTRVAGAILYLNDDFEGGELKFYRGPVIKPVTGLLIVLHSHAVHGVNPMKNGTRYTIGAFYDPA